MILVSRDLKSRFKCSLLLLTIYCWLFSLLGILGLPGASALVFLLGAAAQKYNAPPCRREKPTPRRRGGREKQNRNFPTGSAHHRARSDLGRGFLLWWPISRSGPWLRADGDGEFQSLVTGQIRLPGWPRTSLTPDSTRIPAHLARAQSLIQEFAQHASVEGGQGHRGGETRNASFSGG